MMSLPLTPRNARLLVDELEQLIRKTPEDEVSPDAYETASRLLSSLSAAPGPPDLIGRKLASVRAWTETMLLQSHHARTGAVKTGLLEDLRELRSLIDAEP
jgi:hypothetical protein